MIWGGAVEKIVMFLRFLNFWCESITRARISRYIFIFYISQILIYRYSSSKIIKSMPVELLSYLN